MTSSRTLSAAVLLAMVAQLHPLRAEPRSPPGGSYEVTARLELPVLKVISRSGVVAGSGAM